MCGIVGLYLKNPKLQNKLGQMFKPMIIEMTNRGPDSAGVAIYRNPVKKNQVKFSLAHDDAAYDWKKIDAGLEKGRYLEVGAAPTFGSGLSLAIPVKAGFSLGDYYEGLAGDERFGFFSVGARVSRSLAQASKYGWSPGLSAGSRSLRS